MISINKNPLKYFSFLLMTGLLSLPISTLSNESKAPSLEVTEAEIEYFENLCLVPEESPSDYCMDEYERLNTVIHQFESRTLDTHCRDEEGADFLNSIGALKESVSEAAQNISCTDEAQRHVQKQCAPHLKCNLARSLINTTHAIAPSFIANKVEGGIKRMMAQASPKQCLDSSQPDCLDQVYHSFIGSLLSTLHSLDSIGKAFSSAFWGLKSYLFKKSEDIHSAADTTQSEASLFIKNPGQYLYSKFLSFKNGVDSWLKNNLYCQKWEGKPYLKDSKCVEPLEQYSCLDCNDALNAFCAGAGFIVSEGILNIATAGVATGIGIGSRVGAKMLGETAQLIAARVPSLARASKKTKNVPAKATLLTRTSHLVGRTKEVVEKFAGKLAQSRLGRVTSTLVNGPTRLVDNLTEKTMQTILLRAARTKGKTRLARTIRKTARENLHALRGSRAAAGGKARSALYGARAVRLGNRNRPNRVGSSSSSNSGNLSTGQSSSSHSSSTSGQTTSGSSSGQTTSGHTSSNSTQTSREQTRTSSTSSSEKSSDKKSPIPDLTKGLLAADLAKKGFGALTKGSEIATKEEVSKALNESSHYDEEKSLSQNLQERGVSPKEGESQRELIERKAKQYSDQSQREAITEGLKETHGISEYDAQKVYTNQKNFYAKAKEKIRESNRGSPRANKLKERLSSMRSQLEDLERRDEEIDSIEEANSEAKNKESESAKNIRDLPSESQPLSPNQKRRISSQRGIRSPSPQAVARRAPLKIPQRELQRGPREDSSSQEPSPQATKALSSQDEKESESKKEKEKEKEKKEHKNNEDRIERMEVMSLLLMALEGEGLPFKSLNNAEGGQLKELAEQKGFVTSELEVVTLAGHKQTYRVYKSKVTHEIFVLDEQSTLMDSLPKDILLDYF